MDINHLRRINNDCGRVAGDEKGNLKTTGEWKYEADINMYQNKEEEGKAHEL